MNKTMIVISLAVSALMVNLGITLRAQTLGMKNQSNDMAAENSSLADELDQKQALKKNEPKTISNAFALFVNETKMFETYSGTRMNITFGNSKENEGIEDYLVGTSFRHVKGLPITINVEKFSNETDMAEVLNDIYLLECRTDFKVSGIVSDNSDLIVKGELYGI